MRILQYLFLTALRLVALGFLFLVESGSYSLLVFPGLLIVVASVVAEHGPWGTLRVSVAASCCLLGPQLS